MKIFILEDEIYKFPRNQILKALEGHELTVARSVEEAKLKFPQNYPYDLFLFDHDMRGFYESSFVPHSGYQFVVWMCKHFRKHKNEVLIHSHNSEGRRNIAVLLRSAGFRDITEYSFNQDYVEYLYKRFGNGPKDLPL